MREKAVSNMPLTNSTALDVFITHYFEETKSVLGWKIDLSLFKRIAFGSGVPLIIVDLV